MHYGHVYHGFILMMVIERVIELGIKEFGSVQNHPLFSRQSKQQKKANRVYTVCSSDVVPLERIVLFVFDQSDHLFLEVAVLKMAKRNEGKKSKGEGELVGDIAATLTNVFGERAGEPCLNHTKTPTNDANEESSKTSKADRQS